jgi:hypothetical protein
VTEESDFRPSWAPPPPPPPSHPMQLNFFLKLQHILGNIYAKFQPWVRHMVCQLFPGQLFPGHGCPLAVALACWLLLKQATPCVCTLTGVQQWNGTCTCRI